MNIKKKAVLLIVLAGFLICGCSKDKGGQEHREMNVEDRIRLEEIMVGNLCIKYDPNILVGMTTDAAAQFRLQGSNDPHLYIRCLKDQLPEKMYPATDKAAERIMKQSAEKENCQKISITRTDQYFITVFTGYRNDDISSTFNVMMLPADGMSDLLPYEMEFRYRGNGVRISDAEYELAKNVINDLLLADAFEVIRFTYPYDEMEKTIEARYEKENRAGYMDDTEVKAEGKYISPVMEKGEYHLDGNTFDVLVAGKELECGSYELLWEDGKGVVNLTDETFNTLVSCYENSRTGPVNIDIKENERLYVGTELKVILRKK